MPKSPDITGLTFNRLTVVERRGSNADGRALWLCLCSCGGETLATRRHLWSGHKKSCGCWRRENGVIVSTRHGGAPRGAMTRLYRIWAGMLNRCFNPNNQAFHRYGGQGIKPCEQWRDFVVFRDWALANGYRDDLSIDRIDCNGDYEPSNCRWATYAEQARNKKTQNRSVIRSDGKRFAHVIDAARESGTSTSNIAVVCQGKRVTAGGYGWRYYERKPEPPRRPKDDRADP